MDTWMSILVEMTAYCPCSICCGVFADGRTANNTKVSASPYNLAGDIYSFDFGDEVFIPLGYGALDNIRKDSRVFKVDDRGGALNSEARRGIPRLDLRVQHHWWAKQFGRKRLIVFYKPAN